MSKLHASFWESSLHVPLLRLWQGRFRIVGKIYTMSEPKENYTYGTVSTSFPSPLYCCLFKLLIWTEFFYTLRKNNQIESISLCTLRQRGLQRGQREVLQNISHKKPQDYAFVTSVIRFYIMVHCSVFL